MEKVPQIVRERLRVAAPVVNHPDADVLTAFTERSLPEPERAIVLEHLARCGDCREVVALALPESMPVTAQTAPSRTGWLPWPALRWGIALAGVALIASVGIVQYHRVASANLAQNAQVTTQAKNEVTLPISPPAISAPAVKEPPFTVAGKQENRVPSATLANSDVNGPVARLKKTLRDQAPAPGFVASGGAAAGTLGGPLSHGPKAAYQNQFNQSQFNQSQTQNNAFVANALPLPAAAPRAAPTGAQAAQVQVEAAAPAIQVQNAEAKHLDLSNQPISTEPDNDGYAEARVEKSKSGETAVTIGPTKVLASSTPSGNRPFDYLSMSPRWAITSSGTLQRSYDQGASWQDVPVKSGPGGAVAGMMMVAREAVAPSQPAAPAKAKDAAEAKQSSASETPILFRAVAAIGNEVWAGGTAGRLYHSSDAGSHWVQVVASSGNVALSGDIVSLDFSDAQHGRVTTSNREVWLTSDAGQTWRKQ